MDITSQNIGNEKYGERYVILYSIHVKARKKSFDFSIPWSLCQSLEGVTFGILIANIPIFVLSIYATKYKSTNIGTSLSCMNFQHMVVRGQGWEN